MLSKRSVISNMKKNLELFLKEEMQLFLQTYPDISYSNIAFSYDPQQYEFSLSFNTVFDRNKAMLIYPDQDAQEVIHNPKYWRHQFVNFMDVIAPEHYDAYFSNLTDLYDIVVLELYKFMNSHIYKACTKDRDFEAAFVVLEPFENFKLNA